MKCFKYVPCCFGGRPVYADGLGIRLILFYRRNYHALYITYNHLLLIYHTNVLFEDIVGNLNLT